MVRADRPENEIDRLVPDRSHRSELRFFVIGDFGSGDEGQTRVAEAMAVVAAQEPPDFILGTGDSLYPLSEMDDVAGSTLSATSRPPSFSCLAR